MFIEYDKNRDVLEKFIRILEMKWHNIFKKPNGKVSYFAKSEDLHGDLSKQLYDNWYSLGVDKSIGPGVFFENIIEIIYTFVLDKGDVAIDAGVNHGQHTFSLAKKVSNSGLVIGFEAIQELAEIVESKAIKLSFDQIKIINKAIGANVGKVQFCWVTTSDGFSGIRERIDIPKRHSANIVKSDVNVTTIDQEVPELLDGKAVRFIKLDLEGGEYDALRGGRDVISRDKPLIVLEGGRETMARLYDYSADDWFSLFDDASYEVFDLFGRSFHMDQWNADRVPWYFIAASRGEDIIFVKNKLPYLIKLLSYQID